MADIVVFAEIATGSTLALVRNIKKWCPARTHVVCINSGYSKIFRSSRFVDEAVDIHAESFKGNPVLYFTTDDSCLFADTYREWFETNFTLCLPSSDIVQTFNIKGKAEFEAEKKGLLIPRTRRLEDSTSISEVLSQFNFPVILKPSASKDKQETGFKVKLYEKSDFFKQEAELLLAKKHHLICQEYIPGGDEDVYYYIFYRNRKGILYESMGIKTLQNPPSRGVMAKGKSVYHREISERSRNFLEKIGYTGIGGIEYKHYRGNYYFIEMSTRPEGFYLIAETSDVPVSFASFTDLSGCAAPPAPSLQKDGITYMDLFSVFAARRMQGHILQFFMETLAAFFKPKTSFNTLRCSEIRPFSKLLFHMLKSKINKKS